jgi:hypothetical protein
MAPPVWVAGRDSTRQTSQWTGAFEFLIQDRDAKFTRASDSVWRSTGVEIILTLVRAPNANAVADIRGVLIHEYRWVA